MRRNELLGNFAFRVGVLSLAFSVGACRPKVEPPADVDVAEAVTEIATETNAATSAPSRGRMPGGILERGEFSSQALTCLAKSAGFVVDPQELEPALVRNIALPAGGSVVMRALNGQQRAAFHGYVYPLEGYTRPHVHDVQTDDSDRAWAAAKERVVLVVETSTKETSRAAIEAMIASDCW